MSLRRLLFKGVTAGLGVSLIAIGSQAFDAAGALPNTSATAQPTPLIFNAISVGKQSPDEAVNISNTGSAPLTISGAAFKGADASSFHFLTGSSCFNAPVAIGGSCTIDVNFRPSKVGTHNATLELVTNAAAPVTAALSGTGSNGAGYQLVSRHGVTYSYGASLAVHDFGDVPPIVGAAFTPDGNGSWNVSSNGAVFPVGNARTFGSAANLRLNKPIVGMTATPTGAGYWLVASDGGIFAYGDAAFYGSTGSIKLNQPIVGMSSTPTGNGYWLVASDGGIFAYGDAAFYGSTGSITLNKPVVGMAATWDGAGYWLVASDGGIFAYGKAAFFGSAASTPKPQPIVGIAATVTSDGYWLASADGGVYPFGKANFYGINQVASISDIVSINAR